MFELPPPDPAFEISIATQGMSKGLRQTEDAQFLARGEVALGHVFAGLLWKNIDSDVAAGEGHSFIGYRNRFGGFDLTATAGYHMQTSVIGHPDDDRFEFNVTASRGFGRVTPRVSVTYSPDDFGGTRESLYAEAGASVGLFSRTSLSANVGRRERGNGQDYTAFNAGITYSFPRHLSLDVRFYDTAESAFGVIYEPRVVALLRARF
jgi:outer membrane usher protein FimD/PapC